MKHEQRGKLARQSTRAPRANVAKELALKLARLMSMIQPTTKTPQTNCSSISELNADMLPFTLLLAGLLSVRCAPVSEGTKACNEAKAEQGNQTKPSKTKNKQNATQPKKQKQHEAFAASETSETAFTQNR